MPFYIPNETAEGIAIGANNWDSMMSNIAQLQRQQNSDRAAMRIRQAQRTEELENDALYLNSGGGGRGNSRSSGTGYTGGGGSAGGAISPSNTIDPNTNSTPNERLRDKNAPILAEKVTETGESIGEGNPYATPVIMPNAVNTQWDNTLKHVKDPVYLAKYANTPLMGTDGAAKQAYLQKYGDQIYADQSAAIDAAGMVQPAFIDRMASGDPRSNAAKRAAILQLQGR